MNISFVRTFVFVHFNKKKIKIKLHYSTRKWDRMISTILRKKKIEAVKIWCKGHFRSVKSFSTCKLQMMAIILHRIYSWHLFRMLVIVMNDGAIWRFFFLMDRQYRLTQCLQVEGAFLIEMQQFGIIWRTETTTTKKNYSDLSLNKLWKYVISQWLFSH